MDAHTFGWNGLVAVALERASGGGNVGEAVEMADNRRREALNAIFTRHNVVNNGLVGRKGEKETRKWSSDTDCNTSQ